MSILYDEDENKEQAQKPQEEIKAPAPENRTNSNQ